MDADGLATLVRTLKTRELRDAVGQHVDGVLGFMVQVDQVTPLEVEEIADGHLRCPQLCDQFHIRLVEVLLETVAPSVVLLVLLALETRIQARPDRLDHRIGHTNRDRHRGASNLYVKGHNDDDFTVGDDGDKLRVDFGAGVVDLHWKDRPIPDHKLAMLLGEEYTGENSEDKRQLISSEIQKYGDERKRINSEKESQRASFAAFP